MPKLLITGEPGETFTNDTGKVLYQLVVNWHNSCGQCAQLDHAVGTSFPIPLHRGCRCKQVLVAPGHSAEPFVDFREKIDELDHVQQSRVIGRSNLTLVEKGVVAWSDVVTSTRVRDFREVVARKGLTVPEMTRAGVSPRLAEEAYATVHTPAHELAAQQRQGLLAKLESAGVTREQARQALAERLAARVGIGQGPGGAQASPVVPGTPRPPGAAPLAATRPAKGPAPAVPARKIARPGKPPTRPQVPAVAGGAPSVHEQHLKSLGVNEAGLARAREAAAREILAKVGAPVPPFTPKVEALVPKPPAPPPVAPAKPKPKPPEPTPAAAAAAPTLAPLDAAVAYARKVGVTIDPNGAAFLRKGLGETLAARAPAAYHSATGTIYANQDQEYWRDPAAVMRKHGKSRWFSTSDPEHLIVHEVGHALHDLEAGRQLYKQVVAAKFTDAERAVAEQVSRYGATQPVEFVAEVYAGTRLGKAYPDEVLALYRKYHGPALGAAPAAAVAGAAVPAPQPPPPLTPKVESWTPAPANQFAKLDSGKRREAWGEAQSKAAIEGLAEAERASLRLYGQDNFRWINAVLRGTPTTGKDALPGGMGEAGARAYAERVTQAAARGTIAEAVVAYRGIKDLGAYGRKAPADFRPGDTLADKGLGSSSLDPAAAQHFAADAAGTGVLFEIRVPAGSTGLYLNAGELAAHAHEREFLMPAGTEYRVVGPGKDAVDAWGKSVPVVILERTK